MLIEFLLGLMRLIVVFCTLLMVGDGAAWMLVGSNELLGRILEGSFTGLVIAFVVGLVLVAIKEA